jgi:fatty acyl-CoA reductase
MINLLSLIQEHAITSLRDCFTVVNTETDPIVGWINNLYGAVGVVAGAGYGLLKSMYCDSDIAAEIVPVDMAINNAIAIAWDVAQHK